MIASTIPSTSVERCHGCTVIRQPSTGPALITASTISVSSRPAVPSLRPSPWTKNG